LNKAATTSISPEGRNGNYHLNRRELWKGRKGFQVMNSMYSPSIFEEQSCFVCADPSITIDLSLKYPFDKNYMFALWSSLIVPCIIDLRSDSNFPLVLVWNREHFFETERVITMYDTVGPLITFTSVIFDRSSKDFLRDESNNGRNAFESSASAS